MLFEICLLLGLGNGNGESDDYFNLSTSEIDVADCEELFNEVPDDMKNVLIEKLRKTLARRFKKMLIL
jgi:hypothetical protein